ncbi:ABC transporter permease [Microbacterium sp. zg.Y1090]|uniref:ABC transporter permease n=1 Tax=Microbacterium TaxID=33882 RepID=UPI00214BF578|nr:MULTISPECIES: ABC transporter permease [unclassified Microbacterium]MCR2814011.1 ABC transporter permease [Microbacterium sp. zg.Y1084]MCR2819285.1 ABC transporter permease [Microbacterium sp. zg.Y1090]MDL5487202.1 ABC transporter permease [Microbacterium sp. zg-Y1211]WIM28267.1 ABC transporter permease [Microbacterium sp. zg-Y1090]
MTAELRSAAAPHAEREAVQASRSTRRRVLPPRLVNPLLGAAGLLVFGLAGELLPALGVVRPQDLPPTSAVLSALVGMLGDATLWQAIYDTLYVWALGLTLSSAAGIALGLVIGQLPPVRRATASLIEILRPIPSVALIPLVVLLFGPRYESALVLVVYAAFWQVLVQTIYGAADVDPVVMATARSYRLSLWRRVTTVIWPSALPFVMTGIRLAATVALVLTVTAQLLIGTPGIGKAIALAESAGATDRLYALVIVTGLLGVAVNTGIRIAERHLLRWHNSTRTERGA